jgi:hypothetical protein
MTYSYTQITQYLSCPRRYRHRYMDGSQEKDTRAAMLFGRAFEQAVAALFRREDPAAVLFEQWDLCKDMGLPYSGNHTWDRHVAARHPVVLALRSGRPRSHSAPSSVRATISSPTSTLSVN